MISAIEKQKLVYIMNRDEQARLTISSPLEAHKASTIVFDTCGVDVGEYNAAIEWLGGYLVGNSLIHTVLILLHHVIKWLATVT